MNTFLKSILFIFLIFFGALNCSINTSFANLSETYFIVTAYYSPLPNQKKYSYSYYKKRYRTYNEEKILQGEGHTTASKKGVYEGILAAPAKYPFGTKIYFNGYGVGIVEDRGGAIVKAGKRGHEYDRIDVWMGYGDEGLIRATKWGKRKIKGRVISRNSITNLKFSKNVLNNIENIIVNPKVHNASDVKKLQQNLKQLGLYKGNIDGKYNSIKETLIKFQVNNKVIKSKTQVDAGWFGPKTYLALIKRYGDKDILVKQNISNLIETNEKVQIILNHEEIKLNGDKPEVGEVKKLQELFKKLGMYNGEIDGNFNSIKRPLLDFQKKAGIIKKDNSWGAGYFGEKTKAALITHFENQVSNRKKKITIDDISYTTLNKIGKKLKDSPKSDDLVKKLKKVKSSLKDKSQIKKIEYLIKLLE